VNDTRRPTGFMSVMIRSPDNVEPVGYVKASEVAAIAPLLDITDHENGETTAEIVGTRIYTSGGNVIETNEELASVLTAFTTAQMEEL